MKNYKFTILLLLNLLILVGCSTIKGITFASEGNSLYESGDYQGAQESYEEALEACEELHECNNNLAKLYIDQGELYKGWRCLCKANEYSPVPNKLYMSNLKTVFKIYDERHHFVETKKTTEEVESILGEPTVKLSEGNITGYAYGNICIMFRNNKVYEITFS